MLILAGGCDREYPSYWNNLSRVVLSEIDQPTILSCMFSQDLEGRSLRHEAFDRLFREYFGNQVSIAHATEENFYQQVADADVIYLHGGRTDKLLQAIPDIGKFKHAIKGKIVIGSSAGANFLSSVCFSPSRGEVMRGSGLVPFGVVVHYGIDSFENSTYTYEFWRSAANSVRDALKGGLPILLPEGQFVVIDNENH